MTALPRFHTARSNRDTYGPAIAKVQAAAGQTPMPWQRDLFDVAGEVDPADGSLWYRTVVVRVQRRGGKTAGVGSFCTWRAITTPAARLWYTAQNGRMASEWMRNDYMELLAGSGVFGDGKSQASRYLASQRAGAESVMWRHNRARFQVFPPTRDAMHSKASDQTVIDEAWSFDEDEGADLRQAVRPTLLTRHGSQLWVVSAGGDQLSSFLNYYVDLGTASLDDPSSRIAFVDYGIPVGSDPLDLDNIARHHPAYGITFGMSDLQAALTDFAQDPAGFGRAYGTVDTVARDSAIPAGVWDDAGVSGPTLVPPRAAGLGLDVTPDGLRYALVAAWWEDMPAWQQPPLLRVEVIDAGDVTRATPAYLRAIAGAGGRIGLDALSAGAVGLADAIDADQADVPQHAKVTLTRLGTTHMAGACQLVMRSLAASELRHSHQPDLDDAVAAATWRPALDGSKVWGRKRSAGNIAPLVAMTIAVRELELAPAEPEAPMILKA